MPADPASPYAPPQASLETAAVQRRAALLRTEAGLRTLGGIFLAEGAGLGLVGLALVVELVAAPPANLGAGVARVAMALTAAGLGAAHLRLGRGLRAFAPWARWPAVVACLPLLAFAPLGTIVALDGLWRLVFGGGPRVLSAEHAALRAATPGLVPRSSALVWIGAALLVFGALATAIPSCVPR